MRRLEISLPDDLVERLEEESRYSGNPMDTIVYQALILYLSSGHGYDQDDNPRIEFGKPSK